MGARPTTRPEDSETGLAPVRRIRLGYILHSLRHSRVAGLGAALVVVVVLVALLGPLTSPRDPLEHNLRSRFKPPGFQDGSGVFLLGTDQLGRDILSRLIAGTRVSVIVGVLSVVIAGLIGVSYGLISGFAGGLVDNLMMRVADAFLAIPFIVLVVAVSGVVGAGLVTLILILGVTSWVTYARVTRAEVLAVREMDYVMAARALGQSGLKIMFKHILPNVTGSIIVLATMMVATTMLAEAALSFLGLGVQPPTVTWGLMLSDGRQYIGSAWWMSTFPGIAITLTVLGVVFLGDWLRDLLDPRLRGR
ncbi:MAG: ABC transporter permease [Truepera sp.]|nr:ABC transporter permease [Truepera sp.]